MHDDDKQLNGNLKSPPPTADAVAVAISHDRPKDQAPKVVAGGRGRVAEQILQIAFHRGIKVREDAHVGLWEVHRFRNLCSCWLVGSARDAHVGLWEVHRFRSARHKKY